MNRFHTASEYFLGTGPIVFHSFCNLDEKNVICEIVEAMEYDTFTTFQDWENKTHHKRHGNVRISSRSFFEVRYQLFSI